MFPGSLHDYTLLVDLINVRIEPGEEMDDDGDDNDDYYENDDEDDDDAAPGPVEAEAGCEGG